MNYHNADYIFGGIFAALFVFIGIPCIIYARAAARKRMAGLSEIAERFNLDFNPGEDYDLAGQFEFVAISKRPENCTVSNVLSGKYQDHDVLAFDFRYETSTQNDSAQHECSVFVLKTPATFPDLTIQHAGLVIRTLVAGRPDLVKLESVEFSKHFLVSCTDKKFAYDVCTSEMMQYLLGQSDLDFRIKNQFITLVFCSRLSADKIEINLQRLVQIRSRLPEYLFKEIAK